MDDVEQRFSEIQWRYAEGDPRALKELQDRIAAAGRSQLFINYSDLVRGIQFDLPNLADAPRTIDTLDWQALDRAIVGDFLGFISMRSYLEGQFFASSLVVSKESGLPGEGFYDLLNQVGLLPASSPSAKEEVWLDHVKRAYNWYRQR